MRVRVAGHPRGDPAKRESRRAAGEVLIPSTVREKDLVFVACLRRNQPGWGESMPGAHPRAFYGSLYQLQILSRPVPKQPGPVQRAVQPVLNILGPVPKAFRPVPGALQPVPKCLFTNITDMACRRNPVVFITGYREPASRGPSHFQELLPREDLRESPQSLQWLNSLRNSRFPWFDSHFNYTPTDPES